MRFEPCPRAAGQHVLMTSNCRRWGALLDKPTEHGFGTELWTLKRLGVLIERLYGVKFGQT